MRAVCAGFVVFLLGQPAYAQSSLPDPASTPGALNPAVTQDNIASTICRPGWTRSVRPPATVTSPLKRRQLAASGFLDRRMADYEEDHLVPLELGGAPADTRNLWPEPRKPTDGWTSDRKDSLEGVLNRLVCTGQISLAYAQHAFLQDWTGAYRQYVHARAPSATTEHPAEANARTDYYRSVDGKMVHRPTMERLSGEQVSATCRDGSFSYSHHHQGTCSHHGGVASWRGPGALPQ